jgi:hypothetical protein
MKMTLNIDEELLARVVVFTGAKTKTDAIHVALGEMDRRAKLVDSLRETLDPGPIDWENAYDERSFAMADNPPVIIPSARPARKHDHEPHSHR